MAATKKAAVDFNEIIQAGMLNSMIILSDAMAY
jgi:hypothetical protein